MAILAAVCALAPTMLWAQADNFAAPSPYAPQAQLTGPVLGGQLGAPPPQAAQAPQYSPAPGPVNTPPQGTAAGAEAIPAPSAVPTPTAPAQPVYSPAPQAGAALPYSPQPYSPQPYATQPYVAQPYVAQPYPGPAQPVPGQPYVAPAPQYVPVYPPPYIQHAPPGVVYGADLAPLSSPHWVFTAEALWLERTDDHSVFLGSAITTVNSGAAGWVVDDLRSDDAPFNLATGVKLQLGYCLSNHDAIEVTYYGLQHWSASRAIFGDPVGETVLVYSPYTQTDTLVGGFDKQLGYTYKSTFNNVEVTDRFAGAGGLTWSIAGLWGLRYIQLSDTFTLSGQDLLTSSYENIDVHTSNNLLGPQIGLQIIRDWGRFQLNSEIKAGLFANFNRETYSNMNSSGVSGNPPGFAPASASRQGTGFAGLLEIDLIAKYRLTDHLWLRGGYQTGWIGGVAIAPKQLGGFNHNSGVGLDGPSLGFEFNW